MNPAGAIIGAILRAVAPYLIGAAVLAAIIIGMRLYGSSRYDDGKADAEGKCRAAAIQSQLDAMTADRDAARAAENAAKAELAKLTADHNKEMEGVAEYVEELKSRPVAACLLTDADLRGMRVDPVPVPAGGKP